MGCQDAKGEVEVRAEMTPTCSSQRVREMSRDLFSFALYGRYVTLLSATLEPLLI